MKFLFLTLSLLINPALAAVDLVQVDKSSGRMFLLDGKEIVREYHVAFGGSPKGHKQQEGDQKTPEGHYTLDYKKRRLLFLSCNARFLSKQKRHRER